MNPLTFSFLLCIYLLEPILCGHSLVQEVTFYETHDCTSEGVLFQSKEANLSRFEGLLDNVNSLKYTGWWDFYQNYTFENLGFYFVYDYHIPFCERNRNLANINSFRHIGPLDTGTDAISLYSGDGLDQLSGQELVIRSDAQSDFGFVPRSFVITGHSSWTLYRNEDFSGTEVCMIPDPQAVFNYVDAGLLRFKSVSKGCKNNNTISVY